MVIYPYDPYILPTHASIIPTSKNIHKVILLNPINLSMYKIANPKLNFLLQNYVPNHRELATYFEKLYGEYLEFLTYIYSKILYHIFPIFFHSCTLVCKAAQIIIP